MSSGTPQSETQDEMFSRLKAEVEAKGKTVGGVGEYALAVHMGMIGEGYELVEESGYEDGKELYSFTYTHPRSAMKYNVKVLVVGGKVVALLADDKEDGKVVQASYPLKPTVPSAEVAGVSASMFSLSKPPDTATRPRPQQPAAAPPQPEGRHHPTAPQIDPLRDYGRGDLIPGGGGGNLLGPEAFRGENRGRHGFFGPDGTIHPPPPGARFDPVGPFGGEPDNDLTPYLGPRMNQPPFGGRRQPPGPGPGPSPFGGPGGMYM